MAVDRIFEAGIWSVKAPLKISSWAARVIFDNISAYTADTYANSRFTLADDVPPSPDLTVIKGDSVPVGGATPPTRTASERLQAAILVPHDQI